MGVVYICVAYLQLLAEKDGEQQIAAFRSEKLRVYQRTADCVYDLREYGQEENHDDYGYGTVAGSHVQTKSIGNTQKKRYEIPVFSVDML